jgi:hypothetical protein
VERGDGVFEVVTREGDTEGPFTSRDEAEDFLDIAESSVPGGFINLGGLGKSIRGFLRRNFTSRGNLPESVASRNFEREGWISAQEKQMKYTVEKYDQTIKEIYGKRGPGEAAKRVLDDALKGGPMDNVPEQLRPVLTQMREEIDVLSRRMIDAGMIDGDLEAQIGTSRNVIEENLGVYATRSYRKFDDPAWAEKVPEAIRNRARAFLRNEYPKIPEEQLAGKLEALLYEKDSPLAVLAGGGKVGSKDLTILMKRKDIPEEIRALWGEYRDPKINYARSVTKMSHLIANDKFLRDVLRENLDGGTIDGIAREGADAAFLHRKPVVRDGVKYVEQIDGGRAYAPLTGLYTTPEIAQAFRDALDTTQPAPTWLRYYMRGVGTVKFSKIVLSPMSIVRNNVGNVGFALANGHWRIGKAANAGKATLADIGMKSLGDMRTYVKELAELGIIGQSARAGEMRDIIREASKNYANGGDGAVADAIKGTLRGFARAYELGDDIWKMYAFENELARYRKALPDLPLAEVKKRAARIVTDTYPTYSKVPRVVRGLRRFPFSGTFVSFPAEVMRTGFNTIELAAKELKDPALRAIGAQRLVGILTAGAAVPTMAIASRFMLGLDEKDTESLRRFMPPWARNSNLVFLQRPDNSKVEYIDLSYTDPYNYLRKPVIAMMRGEDWKEKLWDAAVEMGTPFLGEDVMTERLIDIRRNTKRSGGNVFNEQDEWVDRHMAKLEHLYGAFEPGGVTSARRITKAAKGEVSHTGRSYDLDNEVLALGTGFRVQEVDVQEGLRYRARDYLRNRQGAAQLLNEVVTRRGTVTDREIEEAFASSHRARTELFEALHKDALGARMLGVSDEDIKKTLRTAGLSRADVQAVIEGNYRVPKTTALDDMDAQSAEEGQEIRRRKKAVGTLLRSTVANIRDPL